MRIISDLHIHSKHSRACSKELDIKNLEKYARLKGIGLLGTGDFQHPKWQQELKSELKDDGKGIFRTRGGFPFILTSEVSLMYSQGGRGRRVHIVLLAPDMKAVEGITEELLRHGRVDYDGRPIFKIPCPDFVRMMLTIDERIEVIPAHIWTPWFSMFGDSSDFHSVKECFLDMAHHIHAIETGLSSDPEMNWRLSCLDGMQILSFSDSHSFWPWRLGREATIFELDELSYSTVLKAIRTGEGLWGTVEVDPGYGKYHYDGHRNCAVVMAPKDSKQSGYVCASCRRQLTIGVESRVEMIADRPAGYVRPDARKSLKLIPLSELISGLYGFGVATKKTWALFHQLVSVFGDEYSVLLDAPREKMCEIVPPELADVIIRSREGKIKVLPGFDGVYGVPVIRGDEKQDLTAAPEEEPRAREETGKETTASSEKKKANCQKGLCEFI